VIPLLRYYINACGAAPLEEFGLLPISEGILAVTLAVAPLSAYRTARGLLAKPPAHEVLPLIHGFGLQAGDPARAVLLRAASPHWLRHAYAKALVVDHQVPLPVAQALLGHASVQTTAGYAKTDLSQLRVFVEGSFTSGEK